MLICDYQQFWIRNPSECFHRHFFNICMIDQNDSEFLVCSSLHQLIDITIGISPGLNDIYFPFFRQSWDVYTQGMNT